MLDVQGKPIPDNDKENKEQKPLPPKTLLVISLDSKGNTFITGPLEQKKLCIHHLCQAIELVTTYEPSPIIKPKHSIFDFVRRRH